MEIKVDSALVRSHTGKIKTRNNDLKTHHSHAAMYGMKTNYTAYKKGTKCGRTIRTLLFSLSKKIDKDCNNANRAADVINEMDRKLSGQLNKKGTYTSK